MSSRLSYRKAIKLLEKWPQEQSQSKSLAKHVRKLVAQDFPQGDLSHDVTDETRLKQYDAIDRINSDAHLKAWPRKATQTASGVSPDDTKLVLSPDFFQQLNALMEADSLSERIKSFFKRK